MKNLFHHKERKKQPSNIEVKSLLNHKGHKEHKEKPLDMIEIDAVSNKVIGLAIEVHRILGPGLLESAYQQCLAYELSAKKIAFVLEHSIPVVYKGISMDCGFRADFIIGKSIVLELKTVEKIIPIHEAQLLTYLKITGLKLGLIINFNVKLLKEGIKRMVL